MYTFVKNKSSKEDKERERFLFIVFFFFFLTNYKNFDKNIKIKFTKTMQYKAKQTAQNNRKNNVLKDTKTRTHLSFHFVLPVRFVRDCRSRQISVAWQQCRFVGCLDGQILLFFFFSFFPKTFCVRFIALESKWTRAYILICLFMYVPPSATVY